MTNFNANREFTRQEKKSIANRLMASSIWILSLLTSGHALAETSDTRRSDMNPQNAAEQQQLLNDWSMKAHAQLSKRLTTKLDSNLTGMTLASMDTAHNLRLLVSNQGSQLLHNEGIVSINMDIPMRHCCAVTP